MSSSRNPNSGTSGSSSSSPSSPSSRQIKTHQIHSSVAASKKTTDQENPNQETEILVTKKKRTKTGRLKFRSLKSIYKRLDEEAAARKLKSVRIKSGVGDLRPVCSIDTSSDEETESDQENVRVNTGAGEVRPVRSFNASSKEETETRERESKHIKTGVGEFRPVLSADTSSDEETEAREGESMGTEKFKPVLSLDAISDEETETPEQESSDEEEESSEEEYDPTRKLILFPDTLEGDEEYDDYTFLKYVKAYKQESTLPLQISINEREPTRYDMTDLLLFVKNKCGTRYADFSRCGFRNKIIKLQSKYMKIVQEKGENTTVKDFNTLLGKLNFSLMKELF